MPEPSGKPRRTVLPRPHDTDIQLTGLDIYDDCFVVRHEFPTELLPQELETGLGPYVRDDLSGTTQSQRYCRIEFDQYHSVFEPAIPEHATRLEVSVRNTWVPFDLS